MARFPDAEGVVVAYLNRTLAAAGDSARATTRIPSPRPARFVRAVLTGHARRTLAHADAQVTLECWDAAGSVQAFELAGLVYDLMGDLDEAGCHVPQAPDGWVGGPVYLEDPTTAAPRYVMTPIVRMRGE